MRSSFKRWLDILVPGLLLLAAAAISRHELPIIDQLRNLVFDTYQRNAPRPYQDLPVRIIDIDEESLRRIGQWPWPRDLLARLVDRLADAGATTVALDIILAEPDRFSPANLTQVWRDRPELASLRASMAQLPDSDRTLGDSLARVASVTSFALSHAGLDAAPTVKQSGGFATAGDDPLQFVDNFSGVVATLPVIEGGTAGNGFVNYIADADNTIRRVPLILGLGDQLVPSLAAEALRVAQGAGSYTVKATGASEELSFGGQQGVVAVRIGEAIIPTDSRGRMLLHDTGSVPQRYIPAWRVLTGELGADEIAGRIVIVGSTVEALKDLRTTPLAPIMPGVEVHAQVIEQVLAQDFLHRPDWIQGAETLGFVLLGILLILGIRYLGALWSLMIALAAGAGAVAVSWYGFTRLNTLIDPLVPCLVVLLVYLSSSLIAYLRSEREKRFVRDVFSRYMSPLWVAELTRHPERATLGGEMRDLTLMFSDIRGFTRIAEQLDPQELTQLMNRFLTPLTRVIHDTGGTIDKYMGDCIMAFWNAPLDVPDYGRKAIRAALGMREELARLNEQLKAEAVAEGRPEFALAAGIGLNSGRACVGNMGSEQRLDYSVIGDTVNIASRLEGLSRAYGVDIVIGEETAAQAADQAFIELDQVRVKGRTAPLRIFTVLGDEHVAATPEFKRLLDRHGALLAAYRRQDWSAARAALAECRPLAPDLAGLYDVYEQRIATYEQSPPPPDWDGVFTATTKQG